MPSLVLQLISMSSSSAAPSTPRPASVQSDRADNLQYPLSDSDSSLIEHPSTSIMESDTGSEDGMSYLSDSTYEIISQSSFQASDSEDEDDSPATPQDTDDDSIVNFGTVTPSETSRDEEPDTIPQPPDPREESFEEQRLRAETEAEAERDEAIIYTPEELEIDEQLSTPSLNTSTIRGSTITTAGASQSIEDWINFKEPIASVADGLLNVTNEKKQNVASNKIEDSTSRIAHEINETVHNAIEACINLFNMVSRYAQAHIIEPSRQKLPSRDTLAALLPEDPRVTVPSLWAIAAFLATPILINCLVGLAQYSRSGTRITPAVGMAVTSTCLSNATCLQELDAMKAVFIGLKSSQAKVAMIQDILAGKSKSPARSESGLSVYEPTTKPRTGWFGKAKAEPAPERRQEWNIVSWQRKGPIQGPIVLQKTSSLVDQFQVNVSSSQLSRTILFNPQDNATHYPADEAATMRSKIVRVNATAIELHMPSAWPCGNFSVTIKPYPPSSLRIITTQFVFVVEDCKPAFSWKDFDLNNWLVASFAQSSQPDVISGFSSRLWEDFQALLSRHGLSRPTGSAVNAGPTTSDGTCGIAHGGTVCGNWSGGSCCSKDGTCGNS